MLLILGVWRHVVQKFRSDATRSTGGGLFPLGMYTVCTTRLSQAIDAPYLILIPRAFVFIALAAWLMTLLGMGAAALRFLTRSAQSVA